MLLFVAVAQSSTVQFVMYFGFVDDIMFSHNRAYVLCDEA